MDNYALAQQIVEELVDLEIIAQVDEFDAVQVVFVALENM